MPGTAYVLFHHVMGETNGKRGVWGYVKGGMGGLTQALAKAADDLGVEIRTEAEVGKHPRQQRRGDRRRPGQRRRVPRHAVASNADCRRHLQAAARSERAAAGLLAAVKRISYDSASLKINVALSELPNFTACPGTTPGPQHRGTIHLCPDQDFIERAYDDAKYGPPSKRPDPRMHDAVGGRSDASRRRASI